MAERPRASPRSIVAVDMPISANVASSSTFSWLKRRNMATNSSNIGRTG